MNIFDIHSTYRSTRCPISSTTRSRRPRGAATLCSLLLLTASLAPAAAQPEPGPELRTKAGLTDPADVPRADIPALKAAYLECDRSASERLLDHGEAMLCSHVGEALLIRAFERDFNRLLGWWRAEKSLRATTQAAARQSAAAGSEP